MGKIVDLTGQRFGKLIVLEKAGKAKDGHCTWKCKCDCGNETIVNSNNLRSGNTKSCGCGEKENLKKLHFKKVHGDSNSKLYAIWKSMRQRCNNSSNLMYNYYGGRGITVCQEWDNDYITFKNWAIENGYSENLSIDRIDNNKGYSPENCRWATKIQQANNMRNNHYITLNNKTQSLTEWCKELNIKRDTVKSRLYRGWSEEKALLTPVQNKKKEM